MEEQGQALADLGQVVRSQAPSEFTAPSTKISSVFERPQEPPSIKQKFAPSVAASVTSFATSLDEGANSQKRGIPKFPNENGDQAFNCTLCGERLSIVSTEWM